MNNEILQDIMLVVLGGVFGWLLGRLPEKVVYVIIAIVVVYALIVTKN